MTYVYNVDRHGPVDLVRKDSFTKFYVYKRGEVVVDGVSADYFIEAVNANTNVQPLKQDVNSYTRALKDNGYIVEKVVDDEGYKKASKMRREETGRRAGLFRKELFEAYTVSEKQGATILSAMYDLGLDGGTKTELEDNFSALLEMIQDFNSGA